MLNTRLQNNKCSIEDISAYLDGEMNGDDLLRFEHHVGECKKCADEIENQKRLFNALDFALGFEKKEMPLPADFTKFVAKRAESDMQGVRQCSERKRALYITIALALFSFLLLGNSSLMESIIEPVKRVFKITKSISEMTCHMIYDAGLGIVVIARAVSRHFIFESSWLSVFSFLLFTLALFLLSRLVLCRRHV